MKNSKKIILSRLLTSSGDQAWDFAVPITLASQLSHRLDVLAFIFFAARLGHILFLPIVGSLIDKLKRITCLRIGLIAQFMGVSIQAISLIFFSKYNYSAGTGIIIGGIISSMGSSTSSIAVAQDLVPTLFKGKQLTAINSRIRQVDLFSEVSSPFISGLILFVSIFPYAGLIAIALWNLSSFFPEYYLLKPILVKNNSQLEKPKLTNIKAPLWEKFSRGWKNLLSLTIASTAIAYAFLWLSALSPHGVLLTSYLKEVWALPEPILGLFRGMGAIFGLAATVIFPFLASRFGLLKASRFCILSQATILTFALMAFYAKHEYIFLGLILLSRISLYGFSLGEQQIRQAGIPPDLRGAVNSTATALTGTATLLLLGLGSILGGAENFHYLISLSVIFVVIGAIIYCRGESKITLLE